MMNKKRRQKVKSIFEVASEMVEEERKVFLDKECGVLELRSEVGKLLNSLEEADTSFLEEPAEKEVISQMLESEIHEQKPR